MKRDVKELLIKILLKKAKGYLAKEKTDEYVVADGEKKLVRSKVVTKRSPPDVAACKALLELNVADLSVADMTDEELERERRRLIGLLCDNGDGV